jgi:hypothetical protein
VNEDALATRCGRQVVTASDAAEAVGRAKILLLQVTLERHSNPFTESAVKDRCRALNEMGIALSQIKLGAEHGYLQEGAVAMWNSSLPLLQPKLRSLLERPLAIASDTLAAINSPLREVQCLLLLELAKIAEDAKLFLAAQQRIARARLFDTAGKHTRTLDLALERLEVLAPARASPPRCLGLERLTFFLPPPPPLALRLPSKCRAP